MDANWLRTTVLAAAISVVAVAPGQAATITVTTTADESVNNTTCSLREAVTSANNDSNAAEDACTAGSGPDTIVVPAGTYPLSGAAGDDANLSGDLDVDRNNVIDEGGDLTIQGAGDGAGGTIFDADDNDRAIDVQSDTSGMD